MYDKNHWVYVLAKFEHLFAFGLTAAQMRVYIALRAMASAKPVSLTDMASNLGMPLTTMSKCCWRLHELGLATYDYSDTDRRRVVVNATPLPSEALRQNPNCPREGCRHLNRPNHGNPCFCELEDFREVCQHVGAIPVGADRNEFAYCRDCGLVDREGTILKFDVEPVSSENGSVER